MSSTNVHSENENIYCAAAQIIPTEREVEIPPKSAKRGPSKLDVISGETMEIPANDSKLRKDGMLVAENGTPIVQFDEKAYDIVEARHRKENRRTATKAASKGEGR